MIGYNKTGIGCHIVLGINRYRQNMLQQEKTDVPKTHIDPRVDNMRMQSNIQ